MATSMESGRHSTFYATPRQNRIRLNLLDSAKWKNKKVIRMSDYEVLDPNLVLPQTPEDRKTEVLAGIISGEKEDILHRVLESLEDMRMQNAEMRMQNAEMKMQNAEMKAKLDEHEVFLQSAKAVALRFFMDYVHSLYTVGAGYSKEDLKKWDKEVTLQVNHTLPGWKSDVRLSKDIWIKVLNLQTKSSKLSASHAHTSSLKQIAMSLLSPLAKGLLSEADIKICKELYVEVFGIAPENVKGSDDEVYDRTFPLFVKNQRKIWQNTGVSVLPGASSGVSVLPGASPEGAEEADGAFPIDLFK